MRPCPAHVDADLAMGSAVVLCLWGATGVWLVCVRVSGQFREEAACRWRRHESRCRAFWT